MSQALRPPSYDVIRSDPLPEKLQPQVVRRMGADHNPKVSHNDRGTRGARSDRGANFRRWRSTPQSDALCIILMERQRKSP